MHRMAVPILPCYSEATKREGNEHEIHGKPAAATGEFKSLSGAAVALIRRRIIDGQYQPGSKLVIGNISAELDISPGPCAKRCRGW